MKTNTITGLETLYGSPRTRPFKSNRRRRRIPTLPKATAAQPAGASINEESKEKRKDQSIEETIEAILDEITDEIIESDTTAPEAVTFKSYQDLYDYTCSELIRIYNSGLASPISDQQMTYADSLVKAIDEYIGPTP